MAERIQKLKTASDYSGYIVVPEDDCRLANLYSEKTINWFDLLENQYLVIVDSSGVVVDRMKWQDGKYRPINRKPVESMDLGKIRPKNIEQEIAIDLLLDERSTVKVLTGSFGSGKTMLACVCSFQMMQSGRFDKIIWVRNNVEVKDSNPIGFIPGSADEKLAPYAAPLADHIGGREALSSYITMGKIEVWHLGWLRGRDIKNSIIFCSEAEHLTRAHVQLLLGRVAEGSILILEGDFRQIDAKAFETDNGMLAAIDCLKGNKLFSYVNLRESVRSETAKLADLLDKE